MKNTILMATLICLNFGLAQAGTTAKEAAFAEALKAAQQGDLEQKRLEQEAAQARAEQARIAAEQKVIHDSTNALNQVDVLIAKTYGTQVSDQMQTSLRSFNLSNGKTPSIPVLRYRLRLTSFSNGTTCQTALYRPSSYGSSFNIASVCALNTKRTAIFHLYFDSLISDMKPAKQEENYAFWNTLMLIDQSQDAVEDKNFSRSAINECLISHQSSNFMLSQALFPPGSEYYSYFDKITYAIVAEQSLTALTTAIQKGQSLSTWENRYPECVKSVADKETPSNNYGNQSR